MTTDDSAPTAAPDTTETTAETRNAMFPPGAWLLLLLLVALTFVNVFLLMDARSRQTRDAAQTDAIVAMARYQAVAKALQQGGFHSEAARVLETHLPDVPSAEKPGWHLLAASAWHEASEPGRAMEHLLLAGQGMHPTPEQAAEIQRLQAAIGDAVNRAQRQPAGPNRAPQPGTPMTLPPSLTQALIVMSESLENILRTMSRVDARTQADAQELQNTRETAEQAVSLLRAVRQQLSLMRSPTQTAPGAPQSELLLDLPALALGDENSPVVAHIGDAVMTEADLDALVALIVERELAQMPPEQRSRDANQFSQMMHSQKEMLLYSTLRTQALVRNALQRGLDLELDYRNQLDETRRSMLAQLALQRETVERLRITEADVRTFYNQNRQNFLAQPREHLMGIACRDRDEAEALWRALANATQEEFAAHIDAMTDADLKEFSGELPPLEPASEHPLFGNAQELFWQLSRLSPGVVTRAVEGGENWWVLFLVEYEQNRVKPFEAAREEARAMLVARLSAELESSIVEQAMAAAGIRIEVEPPQPPADAPQPGDPPVIPHDD